MSSIKPSEKTNSASDACVPVVVNSSADATADIKVKNKRDIKQKQKKQPTIKSTCIDSGRGSSEGSDQENESSDFDQNDSTNLQALKKGKKAEEYRNQIITDRHGTYNFDEDPAAYRKARKREQNRVSAVNSRKHGKEKVEQLEYEIRLLAEQKAQIESANQALLDQNEQLRKMLESQDKTQSTPNLNKRSNEKKNSTGCQANEFQQTPISMEQEILSATVPREDEDDQVEGPLELSYSSFCKRQKLNDYPIDRKFSDMKQSQSDEFDLKNHSAETNQKLTRNQYEPEMKMEAVPISSTCEDISDLAAGVVSSQYDNEDSFQNSSSLAPLCTAVVCTGMGMASNLFQSSMSPTPGTQSFFNWGMGLRGAESGVSQSTIKTFTARQIDECMANPGTNYEDCNQMISVTESLYRLWVAVQIKAMTLPTITLILYLLALVSFIYWLKPLSFISRAFGKKSLPKDNRAKKSNKSQRGRSYSQESSSSHRQKKRSDATSSN